MRGTIALTYHEPDLDSSPRDRPALEIELTAPMVAAGEAVLYRFETRFTGEDEWAVRAFVAMAKAAGLSVNTDHLSQLLQSAALKSA